MTDCSRWEPDLVEYARQGALLPDEIAAHVACCSQCAVRWEAERDLSERLRDIQFALTGVSSAGPERLMAAFDQRRTVNRVRSQWTGGLAAAAAILVAVLILVPRWNGPERLPQMSEFATFQGEPGEASLEEAPDPDEFIPVPYASPLAQGEAVQVVREELSGTALVRMGFGAYMAGENVVIADLLLGEDGMPRAVRLPESESF